MARLFSIFQRISKYSSAVNAFWFWNTKICVLWASLILFPTGTSKAHRLRPGNGLPRRTSPKTRTLSVCSLKVGQRVPIWVCGNELILLFCIRLNAVDRKLAMASPFKFFQEVREETNKVTWPTRRETIITTVMVFIMAAAAAIFFLVADQLIRFVVTLVLGVGA